MPDLDTCEFETTPFTPGELVAVHAYEAAVNGSGLRDCFDSFDAEHVRWHETEFGQDVTRDMLRAHALMLHQWYEALDSLLGDMLTCTSEFTRYSTAAARYVKSATAEYHQTRQDFEHTVTVWTLALLAGGADGDYPPPTRGLSLGQQTLTTEQ
jgi:hypothetical protein